MGISKRKFMLHEDKEDETTKKESTWKKPDKDNIIPYENIEEDTSYKKTCAKRRKR